MTHVDTHRHPSPKAGDGHRDQARQLRSIRWGIRATLALGVAASVAANVLHARPSPVSQAIAAWPPVALLVTVELIARVPVHRRLLAAARVVATIAIAGIAAYVSYWHMVDVVARYGETGAVPYALPFSVDGLIVVASVSLVEITGRIRNAEHPILDAARTAATRPGNDDRAAIPTRPTPEFRVTGTPTTPAAAPQPPASAAASPRPPAKPPARVNLGSAAHRPGDPDAAAPTKPHAPPIRTGFPNTPHRRWRSGCPGNPRCDRPMWPRGSGARLGPCDATGRPSRRARRRHQSRDRSRTHQQRGPNQPRPRPPSGPRPPEPPGAPAPLKNPYRPQLPGRWASPGHGPQAPFDRPGC